MEHVAWPAHRPIYPLEWANGVVSDWLKSAGRGHLILSELLEISANDLAIAIASRSPLWEIWKHLEKRASWLAQHDPEWYYIGPDYYTPVEHLIKRTCYSDPRWRRILLTRLPRKPTVVMHEKDGTPSRRDGNSPDDSEG